jgi:hypothetical protein
MIFSFGGATYLCVCFINFKQCLLYIYRGTQWCSSVRHCATSRKVAGLIPDDVIGIFHWHDPYSRTMALGLTQPLTEMSTGNIYLGGKGGRCVGLTTLPHSCVNCLEIFNLLEPSGTVQAHNGIALPLFVLCIYIMWPILHFEMNYRFLIQIF